jgi:hypothetical protein
VRPEGAATDEFWLREPSTQHRAGQPEVLSVRKVVVIAPRIAGSGRRLLDGLPPIRLESIRSATSPSGYLLADYRVIR